MGGKSGGEVQVSEYYMSMHVGICAHSSGLELLSIKIGEKEAWRGQVKKNTIIEIEQPELFGGNKKEGGVRGLAWWLNGNQRQIMPEALASRLGSTMAACPGFRGLASIFFTGFRNEDLAGTEHYWDYLLAPTPEEPEHHPFFGDLSSLLGSTVLSSNSEKGFLWSANNPYLKTVSVRVRRASEGLNPSIALIRLPDDSKGNEQYGSNPAHMVFECMTNRDWGMGESFGAFNIGSYEQVAQTLYDEGFGLCMIWTRQSKIEDFIKEILDHIQGAQFVDPATGKHTLKLLRAVDPNIPVPKITPDNGKLSNFAMKLWGEISNEIVVTWTNPETGKEETVTAQDTAAITMQGAQPASDGRNYYGIASQALAISAAERDLAAVVHPIVTCDVEVTKEFWRTVIYDVVELSWPERGIDSGFFRVSQPTYGSDANTVKLSLYEDIFSLDRASYLTPSETDWVNPSQPPEPLIYYQLGTAPAFMTAAALGLNDVSELPYPEAISAITIGPDTFDDVSYEIVGYVSNVTGEIVQQSFGERGLRGTWLTNILLPAQAVTVISALPGYLGNMPQVGQFVLIGMVADEATEIAIVRSITDAGYVLDRGVLDTSPKEWAIGTRLWFIPDDSEIPDATRRAAFETASYHFRTRTSLGLLALSEAPQLDIVLTERPHLPNRPANVRANGVAFGTADFGSTASIPITWSRRNRINESTQVMLWTDGDMDPEAGQTTTIYLMETDRTPITTISGLTGISYNLVREAMDIHSDAILRVVSMRDDMESLQGHEIAVSVTITPIALLPEPSELDDYLTVSGLPEGTGVVVGDGTWWRRVSDGTIVTTARYVALFDIDEYQVEMVIGVIADILSLTRASSATYIDADGLIASAANDVARIDHLGGIPSLLIEPASTNLCLYSGSIDNAAWTKLRTTVITNAADAPDGTATADKLVEDSSASNTHLDTQSVTCVNGTTYTFSQWAKAVERTKIAMRLGSAGFGARQEIVADLIAGTVSVTAGSGSARITAFVDDWFRVEITATATANASAGFQTLLCDAAGNISYTGDGTSGALVWGRQIEANTAASSYIPTTSSQVTRAADVATMNGITETLDLTITYGDGTDTTLTSQSVSPSFWPTLSQNRIRSIIGREP